MKTLKINKDCVYKIKIEKLNEFEDSFFADVYLKATENLIGILNSNDKKNSLNDKSKDDEFNNIISFVGERGSGKTSSMISFRNSLQQFNYIKEINKNQELKTNYEKIAQNRFHDLDTIDPSVFNGKDSIIEIVVAEMFKKFKAERKKQDYIKKQELVKDFEIVYKDLRTLNKDKHTIFNENLDNLEVLMDLSSAISLKSDIEKLITSYLDYMEDEGNTEREKFLTITIDDLDMNIAAGEKMIEDIRKYLIIPKVVIMMAVKFEQLEEVIKQKNIKDLNALFNYYETMDGTIREKKEQKHMTKLFDEELNNKTNRYLEKVIPYNKRIYMPEVYGSDAKIEVDLDTFYYKEKDSIEMFIAKSFYRYLRYTIVTKTHYNVIVPNNLRGLVDLILLISTFGDVESCENDNDEIKNKENVINNLKSIEQYFDKIIIHKISNLYAIDFLKDILKCPIQSINKKILLYLNSKLCLLEEIFDKKILIYLNELYKMERRVVEKSVTLGDVITWMKLYEDTALLSEEKIFMELLKAIYSIRLISEIYAGTEEIIHILGKDIVGKYFEFIDNKHDQKIEMNARVTDGQIYRRFLKKGKMFKSRFSIVNPSYYSLLEPQFINEDRYVLAKLYRDLSNTVKEKMTLELFYFKPFNIFGVNDKIYNDIYNKTKPSTDKELLLIDNSESTNYLSINNYILFLNMDFYMLALMYINKALNKDRLSNSYNPKTILDAIYNVTNESFSELCNQCSYLNINNPIKNIFEDKNFDFNFGIDFKFVGNDATMEDGTDIERNKLNEKNKNIERDIYRLMSTRLKRFKKYLTDIQKKYFDSNGIKGNMFSQFETTIKNNYIVKIIEFNNKISKLNINDINYLSDNLLSITDIRKQDNDIEKEKIRINNIINDSMKEIDTMLKNIEE